MRPGRGPGEEARRRPDRSGSRRGFRVATGAALLGAALVLAGCDAGQEATGPSGQDAATVRVAASLPAASASMHGAAQAYEATDRLRVQLQRLPEEELVVDRFFDFDPSAPSTEVSVRISLEEEAEDFFFSMRLLADGETVFRGSDPVTLEAGRTTSVDVVLEPVPDRLALPVEVATLTALGDTVELDGAVLFATGDTIPDAIPTWSSLDPEIATASSDGIVVAQSEGEARIVAAYAALTDTVTVVVDPAVANVVVEPNFASIQTRETFQFSARVEDANGNSLTGRTVTWASSNTTVATIDQTGLARADTVAGSTTITAESEGVPGTATLRVTDPQAIGDVTPVDGGGRK